MKKSINLLFFLFAGVLLAQETSQAKDSVKTEVINVVTSFAPKITDAFKIKKKPVIELSQKVEKKALDYKIISVPVASTFVPKSGTLKPINLGKRERLFDNYFSLGFGNNFNPYLETYFHKTHDYDSEYKVNLRFNLNLNPVDTELSSTFYEADANLFYKHIGRYFDWKVGFDAERNQFNWYGLPANIIFQENVINYIDPKQLYKNYKVYGGLEFEESYIKNSNIALGYFSDDYSNDEVSAEFDIAFAFPTGRFGINSEDLNIDVGAEYLAGGFNNIKNPITSEITSTSYGFLNAYLHPYYEFNLYNFDVRIGAKGYFTLDTENSINEFLPYPDVNISYPIIKQHANLYVGAIGDLINNSYQNFANLNPYVAPNLLVTQTNQVYNAFAGLKGIVNRNINYNVKASFSDEKNKPLFLINQSESNGLLTGLINSAPFNNYEFGNSFSVVYDDIKTLTFAGEAEYDYSKQLSLGVNFAYNLYTLTNQDEAWGLPQINGDIFGVYKKEKWYAGANIYYVGNRKGQLYLDDETIIYDIPNYVDINLNGGYHFDALFSAFLKVNNALNSSYQRHQNFNTQGIQVMAGIIWKFDSFF